MPKILIVDDEQGIQAVLSAAFEKAGYEVRTAGDGPEAIERCTAESFDAVLSDVVMPSMNGHDLVRWIVERYPATSTVLMSGYDTGCETCPIARRCKLLNKPFRPTEAVALVEQVLRERPAA